MKPAPFTYYDPHTLDEALGLLAVHGDAAKILAGGQSLVPLLNMRLAAPDVIVDINRLPDLDFVTTDNGLRVGALARQAMVERDAAVRDVAPLVTEAIAWVGHRQIRNRGTLVGSLAHADPAAEMPLVFLALDGELHLRRTSGSRRVSAGDFFVHIMTTALDPEEIATEASLPPVPPGSGSAFLEVARRHGDFAVAAIAVVVTIEAGRIRRARVALGGVGPTPLRATRAEERLVDEEPTNELFVEAALAASHDCEPVTDIHGTAEYRRELVRTMVYRGLGRAVVRARTGAAG